MSVEEKVADLKVSEGTEQKSHHGKLKVPLLMVKPWVLIMIN